MLNNLIYLEHSCTHQRGGGDEPEYLEHLVFIGLSCQYVGEWDLAFGCFILLSTDDIFGFLRYEEGGIKQCFRWCNNAHKTGL